ncbi:transposase [Streptomyces sp. NPDC054952]
MKPSRPRRRPEALLGDKGYDSNPNRDELRKRRILPVISRKGAPNIKGMGKLRYGVEQTFALLHQFKRLAVRRERRPELHDAFVSRLQSHLLETPQQVRLMIMLRALRGLSQSGTLRLLQCHVPLGR